MLNTDERRSYGNNFPSTSNASSSAAAVIAHHSRRNPRIANNHHKRFSLNENSIDGDNIDVSFAFPHDFDKYSDDIWRKTVSSDCDQSAIPVWEKQPEPSWGAASSGFYEPSGRSARLFDDDHELFSTGNFFFPTSGASSSSVIGNGRRLPTGDKSHSNRRKHHGNRISSVASTALDSDDEFQTIKKRLSLSSLRNSLCRPCENLNNENQGATGSSVNPNVPSGSNDDFLQVIIFII